MNAEISETVRARMLGLGMQILRLPVLSFRSFYQYPSTCQLLKSDQSLRSYYQIIIKILQFIRDCTPHAANQLFLLIRHQAARGAIG